MNQLTKRPFILRFISLYYSSIGFWECIKLFFALLISPFVNSNYGRKKLNKILKVQYASSIYFPFATARSALSAFFNIIDLKDGDEVILSSFTCLAVPTAVIAAGGIPIYVDIERDTLNTSVPELLNAITPRTRAVVLQHTFGNPADVQTLVEAVSNKKIFIIEDCALSIGTKINESFVGSFADASILSFELSKTISVGWGGILVVNNNKLFSDSELYYKNVPIKCNIDVFKDVFQTFISAICHKPSFYFIGKYIIYSFFRIGLFRYSTTEEEVNLKFTNGFIFRLNYPFIYLATHQLSRLGFITEKCNCNYKFLKTSFLKNGFTIPDKSCFENNYFYPTPSRISILISSKQEFLDFFNKNNIEVGLWFDGPLSPYPSLDVFKYCKEQYPEATYVADHIVNLPCHSRLNKRDLNKIDKLIESFAKIHPEMVVLNSN